MYSDYNTGNIFEFSHDDGKGNASGKVRRIGLVHILILLVTGYKVLQFLDVVDGHEPNCPRFHAIKGHPNLQELREYSKMLIDSETKAEQAAILDAIYKLGKEIPSLCVTNLPDKEIILEGIQRAVAHTKAKRAAERRKQLKKLATEAEM